MGWWRVELAGGRRVVRSCNRKRARRVTAPRNDHGQFAPFCGSGYQRHLLETDAVIVVWATGTPGNRTCAAAVTKPETFTLHAPIGDKPVIDSIAGLVLPATANRPQIP